MISTRAPQFSVVMPCFNAAPYLEAAIDSLFRQTWRDFEVIVVDDGSVDGSARIAREHLSRRGLTGKVIERPASAAKGVSTCRNIGLQRARGSWIAFLDADDLFLPEKLERVHDVISRGTKCRAVFHKSRRFSHATGEILDTISEYGREGEPLDLRATLLEGNILATCGTVVDGALLREIGGFSPELSGVEDWWLAIQVSVRTRWMFISQVLAEVRIRDSSLMTNAAFEHYVSQHLKLIRVASTSGELVPHHVTTLRRYALGPLMRYFVQSAFGREGWAGLWRGLARLAGACEVGTVLRIVVMQARFRTLVHLARAVHWTRRVRARSKLRSTY